MSRRRIASGLALAALLLSSLVGIRFAAAQSERELAATPVRFAAINVYFESVEPLAAWQFELSDPAGAMAVVGIENGDSDAFPGAPHYDMAAVEQDRADRIVVADFSLADRAALPSGRTRVATVHVRIAGARTSDFELQLIAAGNEAGEPIAAEAIYELQDGRAQ